MATAPLSIGIIEDHDDLRDLLAEVLQDLGHQVIGFPSAEDLEGSSGASKLDLLLLDLNLPGEDGLSVASRLKLTQPSLRVIMMTTRAALQDRVSGYRAGADLYLPKPLAEEELVAAVQSMARQIQADAVKSAERSDKLLRLDVGAMQLRGSRGVATLVPADIVLLTTLVRAPGQRLEHWQLIEALGLEVDDAGRANLSVRLTRLRAKLNQAGCPEGSLKSLRSSGYQLCVALEIQ